MDKLIYCHSKQSISQQWGTIAEFKRELVIIFFATDKKKE